MLGSRRWVKVVAAVVVLLVAGAAVLAVAYFRGIYSGNADAPGAVFIAGGTLFAGTDSASVPNPGILLEDGLISCVGRACARGTDAAVVDATGRAILPGLIDLHVHFFTITADNARLSMPALIWNYARLRPDVRRSLLASGITTIRSVGDPDIVFDLKLMLDTAELGGPRMLISGPLITAPGGHPTQLGGNNAFAATMTLESDDPDEIAAEVAVLAERGVDGIKLVLQEAVSDTGEVLLPSLSAESYRAAVAAAETHGLWVATHVGSEAELQQAARAGTSTIEHGVRHGNRIGRETLELLVESGVIYVPTLQVDPMGALNIRTLHEAGVAIGVGTDTNRPTMRYGDSYHRELEALVDAGLPAAETLLAATRNAAKALGMQDRLGTIEAGKAADIVLVRGEPWNDIAALRNIETVIQGGHIVLGHD